MNTAVMHEMSVRSLAGTITFPEVVTKLVQIGVESYHVDLRRKEKTHYLPDGQTHCEALEFESPVIAQEFSGEQVIAAIKASQRREIDYREFLRRIMQAGTTQYFVFLSGKMAVYLGRKGEFHIEHFPQANQNQQVH